MATNRIVLLITDEEIARLGDAIKSLDDLAAQYDDDWQPDEEPLASLNAQAESLANLMERIEKEVLAS